MDVWARRLLLVEDEPLLAALMGQVLSDAGFVVAICHNEEEGRDEARLFDPDAALIDVHLGSTPAGLYLAHALSHTHPHLGILLLSRYEDLSAAGLSNWDIPKQWRFMRKTDLANNDMLVHAIDSVLTGTPDTPSHSHEPTTLGALTATQIAVLRLAAIGLTNTAIAERRGTTERNIEQRLKSIYATLGIPVGADHNPRVLAVRHYITAAGLPDDAAVFE